MLSAPCVCVSARRVCHVDGPRYGRKAYIPPPPHTHTCACLRLCVRAHVHTLSNKSPGPGLAPFPALQGKAFFLAHPGFGISTPWSYQNLVINNNSGTFTLAPGIMTISKNLTITSGTFVASGSTIIVNGNWVNTGGVFQGQASSVTFAANTAGYVQSNAASSFGYLTFNGTGSSQWTLNGTVAAASTMTIAAGSTVNASSQAVTLGGGFVNSGTFNTAGSTLTFNGTTAQTYRNPGQNFSLLIDSNSSAGGVFLASTFTATQLTVDAADLTSSATLYFVVGSTYIINALNLTGSPSHYVTLRSSALAPGSTWYLNNTTNNAYYVDVQDSNAMGGNVISVPIGGIDSGNNHNWALGAGITRNWVGGGVNANWNNAYNWDTGMPALQDSANIPPVANTPVLTASIQISSLTIQAGSTVTLNGYSLTLSSFTVGGNLVLLGTETVSSIPNLLAGSSVTYIGSGSSVVMSSWSYRNLVINGSGGTFNLASGFTLAVNEMFTVSSGTLNQGNVVISAANYNQTGGIFSGGTANMTVVGAFLLTSPGIFNAPTASLYSGPLWTNAGVFNPQTGTVVFNTSSTLTGQTTFFNFTAGNTVSTLTFAAASTQTITNNFTITGLAGGGSYNMCLRSTIPGQQFFLNSTPSSSDLIQYVDVRDSNASGNTLASMSPSTTTGNTTNWAIVQQASPASGGTTETSPNRRIVENAYGIWIFYDNGGNFSFLASADGGRHWTGSSVLEVPTPGATGPFIMTLKARPSLSQRLKRDAEALETPPTLTPCG